MPELLLHYIWHTDGRRIEVIDVGLHNSDAGPDFFNAKLRIDGVLWIGNIEIHVLSSDWYRHGHNTDNKYDNIILHVVRRADKEVYNSRGESIAQCELQYPHEEKRLERLLIDRLSLCSDRLIADPTLLTDNWRQKLLNDRMQKKADAINQLLSVSGNNWEEAFYVTLAHNFGFHTNSLPFELVAKSLPLAYILKHRDNLFQLEALLFGQSGLLTQKDATDDYSRSLYQEYLFLQKKFSLMPIDGSMWKLLRMHPQNFPHRRIAQFAALLHKSEFLFSSIIEKDNLKELRDCFVAPTSEYWHNHYRFAAESPAMNSEIGRSAVDVLLINTVAPYKSFRSRECVCTIADDSGREKQYC